MYEMINQVQCVTDLAEHVWGQPFKYKHGWVLLPSVPISEVKKYRGHGQYKSAKQVDQMTEDIKIHGVTTPPSMQMMRGQPFFRDGHHRLIAAEKAGLTHIPIMMFDHTKEGQDAADAYETKSFYDSQKFFQDRESLKQRARRLEDEAADAYAKTPEFKEKEKARRRERLQKSIDFLEGAVKRLKAEGKTGLAQDAQDELEAVRQTMSGLTKMNLSNVDLAEHVPGTPFKYSHGWKRILPEGNEFAAPAWKPSMTRSRAEVWAKDSAIKDALTHVTKRSLASEIKKRGFKVSGGGTFGDGVYLGAPQLQEKNGEIVSSSVNYYGSSKFGLAEGKVQPKALNVMVNVNNPLTVDLRGKTGIDGQEEISKAVGKERFAKAIQELRGKYDSERSKAQWGSDQFYAENAMMKGTSKRINDHSGSVDMSMILEHLGYDSIIIKQKRFTIRPGGSQIVVFNPKNVTVIADEKPRYAPVKNLSNVDLAMPQIWGGTPKKLKDGSVLPKPGGTLVEKIGAILANKDVDSLKVKKVYKLLKPFGVGPKAVAYAMISAGFGKSGGTTPSPNARLAQNGIHASDKLAATPARTAATQEISYRSAFVIKTASRMQGTLNTVADREVPQAKVVRAQLADDSLLYRKHESARKNRLDAAARSGKSASTYGSDLVGWYLNPALNNESECIAADGNNFYASQGTVLGWPGAVHPNCGCASGPAHENGGMVNDAVNHLMGSASVAKVFKLKRKAS